MYTSSRQLSINLSTSTSYIEPSWFKAKLPPSLPPSLVMHARNRGKKSGNGCLGTFPRPNTYFHTNTNIIARRRDFCFKIERFDWMESRIRGIVGDTKERDIQKEGGGGAAKFPETGGGEGFRIERVELVRNRSPIRAVITIRTKLCRPGSGGDVSSI